MKITLVSYNISKSIFLQKKVEEYLNGNDDKIILLQEVPFPLNVQTSQDLFHIPESVGVENGTIFLCSNNLKKICKSFEYRKNGSVLTTPFGKIANVHMPNMDVGKCGVNEIKRYGTIVDGFKACDDLIIVGGDFNANPFSDVMGCSEFWCAKRSIEEKPKTKNFLLNLFWSLLYIGKKTKPIGSTEIVCHTEVVSKAVYDQFLIDPKLISKVYSYGIRQYLQKCLVDSMSAEARKYAEDYPKDYKFDGSFHYPVYLTIELGV